MGLTSTGYTRLTYDDILTAKIQKAKELFGEDIETSELTPLGKFIRINAYDQAKAEEEAEQIYYARFPNTASGVSLDRLCVFVGISRNPATAARYTVSVEGTAGYTVPLGFLVSTESGIKFYNLSDTVIGEDGTCTISVDCDTAGEIGNVDYTEITGIVNPDADITSVRGISADVEGTEEESDYSLRQRFAAAREGQGSCNASSITAALVRIESVTSASVVSNDTDETVNGRPPHSFECYISGGEDHLDEIAATIFEKKPIGIKTYGSESYTLTDADVEGLTEPYTVYFSHIEDVPVSVQLKVKVNEAFGENGTAEIIENLSSYINSLGIGGDVILSALYGQIHAVTGVTEVTELTLSVNGVAQGTTVNIGTHQIAKCDRATTTVEVVA